MFQMSLLIAVGVVWQYFAPAHISALGHRRALTDLVFYVLLPAMVLKIIWAAQFDASTLKLSITALVRLGTGFGLMWICLHFVKVNRAQKGALLLAATFPNATYLGLPVTTELLGNHAQETVIKFDLFGCTPILLTLGVLMVQHYSNITNHKNPILELTKVPPLWALLLALVLNVSHTPQPLLINHALSALAGGVIPLMLIALGMSIKWDTLKPQDLPKLALVSVIVLAIAPLATYGVVTTLNLPHDMLVTATLLSAMPTMIFGIILCERYEIDGAFYAAAVLITTILSIVSLSLWYASLVN
jgi:malate permease and related proteins